jgi:DMSO reductase anchor subunit
MTTRPFDEDRPPEPPRRTGERRKRRRGDPNATVPEAEFTSYYGHNVVQAPPWEWPIPAYIFLGGVAAGSGLIAAGGHFTDRPRLRTRGRIAAIIATAAGGVALAGDLGRPERALNMMRTVKLTSPMSVGSWILAGFGAFAGAAVGLEVVRSRVPGDGVIGKLFPVADGLAAAGSAFFAPPLAAYTGVLLADTALPTWHEAYRELPFIFVSSAIAAGSGLAMITTPAAETRPARQLAVLGAGVELVVGELMTRRLGDLAEPFEEQPAKGWHRASKILTAAGAIGAALVGGHRIGAALSGVALLAGSLATRFGVFEAGMESAKDPKYTVKPQRARAAEAAAQGKGVTQPGGPWPGEQSL